MKYSEGLLKELQEAKDKLKADSPQKSPSKSNRISIREPIGSTPSSPSKISAVPKEPKDAFEAELAKTEK